MKGTRILCLVVIVVFSGGISRANPCLVAARTAAIATGVPEELLAAISVTETGYRGSAWPWTLNHAGKSRWFDTRQEAEAEVSRILDRGENADVGCFQINTGWHGKAFPSVGAMMDPEQNALYAARFLRELFDREGGWPEAVAAYHSTDEERGTAYLLRVSAALKASGKAAPVVGDAPRRNGFPLLVSGATASVGSVVPKLGRRTPLIGAP